SNSIGGMVHQINVPAMRDIKLFLDDVRDPPDDSWILCRTPRSFRHFVRHYWDDLEVVSLDHDLGEDVESGYDVVCSIERMAYDRDGVNFEILVHSQNPVGRANIERAIKAIKSKFAE